MQLFKRPVSPRGLTAFGFEVVLISASLMVAMHLYAPGEDEAGMLWKVVLAAGLCQICLYYSDFYDLALVRSSRDVLVRLLQAAGAASIILAAIYAVAPSLAIRDGAFLLSLALVLTGILSWRILFNVVTEAPPLGENILIVGTGPSATAVTRSMLEPHDFAYRLVGVVDDAPGADRAEEFPGRIGGTRDIPALVARHGIDRIVVAASDRRGRLPMEALLQAKLAGVRVEDATVTYERLTGTILLEDLKPSWLVFSDGFRVSRARGVLKRASDLAFAVVGLVLSAPFALMTALAVWLESGRPVLYRQERVGQHGRVFTLFKFRSMRVDAEGATPVWAREQDDRITRVGRVIRRTRLDELPQLWNVLRGDMSLVGPRPERPYFVEQLARQIPFYHQRHAVKPGVTGWAQVKYRYGASVEDAIEKLRYDLYYIKHLSLAFDFTILIDTVKVILFGRGAQ